MPTNKGPVYEKLKKYSESNAYGFHMPGHKRQVGEFINPYKIDITEIHEFDDLHHPNPAGILSKAQERAARLYGAEETHFLVNGSTAGILSAISGCTSMKGKILMARNCHRSVYHAVALRNLEAEYLYPQQVESLGINGAILPQDVENALGKDAKIQAVFLTSPTYEGVCSDVRSIAEICHRYKVPLLVDQAHGAHFPFSDYFPEDAVKAGADVVIHSVHKSLPAMTQTALLHLQGELANREKIRYYLSVYQTSSPSYVLMASIDSCMEFLEQDGEAQFASYVERLERFREVCKDLKVLRLAEVPDFDRSKLLIYTGVAGISGEDLSGLLRERYQLEMEMTTPTYLLGISSVADTQEGLERFSQALVELDQELQSAAQKEECRENMQEMYGGRIPEQRRLAAMTVEAQLRQGEALEQNMEPVVLEKAAGRICGAYIYLYPPGIPLLVPGEVVTEESLKQIAEWEANGLEVHGLTERQTLLVLKEQQF